MKAWLPAMPLESPLATRCVKVVEASDSVGLGVLVQRFGMPEERCSCGKDVMETVLCGMMLLIGGGYGQKKICAGVGSGADDGQSVFGIGQGCGFVLGSGVQ